MAAIKKFAAAEKKPLGDLCRFSESFNDAENAAVGAPQLSVTFIIVGLGALYFLAAKLGLKLGIFISERELSMARHGDRACRALTVRLSGLAGDFFWGLFREPNGCGLDSNVIGHRSGQHARGLDRCVFCQSAMLTVALFLTAPATRSSFRFWRRRSVSS